MGIVRKLIGVAASCVLVLSIAATAQGQRFQIGDRVLVTRSKTVDYANGQRETIYPATVLQIRGMDDDGRLQIRWSHRATISNSYVISADGYGVELMRGWLRRQPCTANRINLGAALLLAGNYQDALSYFQEALQKEQNSPWACNALGWFYATCPSEDFRDGQQAIEYCRRACELSGWRESMFVTSLACAYAEQHDFDQAVELIKKALLMDEKFRGFRASLLEDFQAGRAYHSTELLAS